MGRSTTLCRLVMVNVDDRRINDEGSGEGMIILDEANTQGIGEDGSLTATRDAGRRLAAIVPRFVDFHHANVIQ